MIEDVENNRLRSRDSWSNFDSQWLESIFGSNIVASRHSLDYEIYKYLTEIPDTPSIDFLEIPSQNEI